MKANALVSKAVKNRVLPHVRTLLCADCGKQATDYDHRDYDKPLEVEPTCRSCNIKRGPALGEHHHTPVGFIDIKIRLPQDVHFAVKKKAVEEGRSMNKQIIQIVKESVGTLNVVSK